VCFGISPFEECLRHDDYAFPWDVVFLDEFTKDPFGMTLGVGIGCIEGLALAPSLSRVFWWKLALIPAS